ncbi:hypothetical protein H2200_001909 [Cladophialophora chaetospira]|uniref:Uncharacterized protein n=1 Tax=Cladophialophora chaetospira TaxID=386627 RepID=A0AA39CQ41_9EURO|nr:hypothetical protein H2200_001909 [Cladophialophora chaetospira]
MANSARRMVTAAVNCARNSMAGDRRDLACQALLNVQGLLQTYGFAHNLDMALLNLYLSKLLEDLTRSERQNRENSVIAIAVSCLGERFEVILPEIQDRESVFLASSLKKMLRNDLSSGSYQIRTHCLDLQTEYHEHLYDCGEVRTAIRTIFEWCRNLVQKNRRTFNQVGARLPFHAWNRIYAARLLYCSSIFGISSFDSLIQSTETFGQVPICKHGIKPLMLDTPLALAVISESLSGSGSEKTGRRLFGSRFGDYLLREFTASIHNWPARGPDFARAYLSQMDDIPTAPNQRVAMAGAGSDFLRELIVAAFRTRKSSLAIDRTSLSEAALLAYSSLVTLGTSAPRNSIASSFHSSINSIRSSMSLDTKRTLLQMRETRDRMRRPISMLSTWSKKTSSSTAMSIDSQGSSSFEKVTGMPAYSPDFDVAQENYSEDLDDEDLMTLDRIDEELDDVDLYNNPSNQEHRVTRADRYTYLHQDTFMTDET